ncbi:MAG: metallophosphoesterase [Phycisphaeraceae bacterium]|nr:metallophosphoesterase [Phycisphaeraceae bacterium]
MQKLALLLVAVFLVLPGPHAAAQDNIGHDRHRHHHNPKHPTEVPTPARFVTSRASDVVLPLPEEKDAFVFAVFGDRTGGPVDGVKVLADAVRDVNLLEPDLVMTVGDLINGYNTTPAWLEQMREYKEIMNELRCPWFPVAGNHDVYWRGEGRPPEEHEANYEMHFGPLWYAFRHKNCWFIALYSDEANPETGERNFNKPECQRMSDEQFSWLKDTLRKAADADHIFLFLHHPRWLGGQYGDDWDKVHRALVAAGNVTAVFAGHIHRMRYDPKDGIEYVTLATVGGGQGETVPQAGWLHQYHLVTVRKQQVALAALPVGEVMDVREITGQFADECARLVAAAPRFDGPLTLGADGTVSQEFKVTINNPTSRQADFTITPDSADLRWLFSPDHTHAIIEPGGSRQLTFRARRAGDSIDALLRTPDLVLHADVLMPGHRYAMPERRIAIPLNLDAVPPPLAATPDLALHLSGTDALRLAPGEVTIPDGPFTVECWINADSFSSRIGIISRAENSEWGLFVNNGRPHMAVHLSGRYIRAESQTPLKTGQWHHLAGVFDGKEVRMYVDGVLRARTAGQGPRTANRRPILIGADPNSDNAPMSFFRGSMDSVRISSGAVYTGETFSPSRRLTPAENTLLLLNMDALFGRSPWTETPDGRARPIGTLVGSPVLVPAE